MTLGLELGASRGRVLCAIATVFQSPPSLGSLPGAPSGVADVLVACAVVFFIVSKCLHWESGTGNVCFYRRLLRAFSVREGQWPGAAYQEEPLQVNHITGAFCWREHLLSANRSRNTLTPGLGEPPWWGARSTSSPHLMDLGEREENTAPLPCPPPLQQQGSPCVPGENDKIGKARRKMWKSPGTDVTGSILAEIWGKHGSGTRKEKLQRVPSVAETGPQGGRQVERRGPSAIGRGLLLLFPSSSLSDLGQSLRLRVVVDCVVGGL